MYSARSAAYNAVKLSRDAGALRSVRLPDQVAAVTRAAIDDLPKAPRAAIILVHWPEPDAILGADRGPLAGVDLPPARRSQSAGRDQERL